MNTLQAELRRLYLFDDANSPDPSGAEPGLVAPDGRVRAMVLELARPADWSALSTVWQGVQADLELPAPAVAVSGIDGYQLWFSLAQPASVAQARAFLEALRQRYLAALAPERIGLMPSTTRHARMVPAQQSDTGRWSAFVSPDLAGIFSAAPWLDVCPSPEAQAKVLSRLECIQPDAFQAVLDSIGPAAVRQAGGADKHLGAAQALDGSGLDPKRFLHGVMNDQTIALHLRIAAATALLPYGDGTGGGSGA